MLKSGIHAPADLLANAEPDEFCRLFVQKWTAAVDTMVMGTSAQLQPVEVHDRANHRLFVVFSTNGDLQYDRDGEAVDENDPKFRRLRKPKHLTGKHVIGTTDWCVIVEACVSCACLSTRDDARLATVSQVSLSNDGTLGKVHVENQPRGGLRSIHRAGHC
jgi:hypothetical protein